MRSVLLTSDTPRHILFADHRTTLIEALTSFLPAERVSVAEHAAQHRFLNNRGGGIVGRWDNRIAPYLIGPMEALTSPHQTVAVVGPARSGKTTIGQNWLLQSIETDPADFLVYAATDSFIESYVKSEIEPMIELHEGLRSRLGHRPKDRALSFKRFHGMRAEFLSATYNNLIGKSAARIIITELDACAPSGDRNAYDLASIRRQTYGSESTLLAESHPDAAKGGSPKYWTDGIMRLYRDSDRRRWWWPCPHCNSFSSPSPGAEREMTLSYPEDAPIDEIAARTFLLCPSCGALIEDSERHFMLQDGFWAGTGQTVHEDGTITGELVSRDVAGFWITGAMLPPELYPAGIGGLATRLVQARRDFEQSGDDAKLKEVWCKGFGIPYTRPRSVRSVDAEALALREDPAMPLRRIPDGVRFMTAAADIQANRFELLVRGWGVDGESWVIDYQQIPAETATDQAAWDALINRVLRTPYPLASDPARGLHVLCFGYDSGGSEGVTVQAYDAWRRARKKKLARFVGKIEGREVYTLMPLKGAASASAPLLSVRYPDSQRAKSLTVKNSDIPLGQFNPNLLKDRLSSDLLITESGPRCVHFPQGIGELHDFYDQLAAEERTISGSWVKKSSGSRNEVWDMMVMNDAMSHLFGLHRISWDKPPKWAAPLTENVLAVNLNHPAPDAPEQSTKNVQLPTPTKSRSAMLDRLRQQAAQHGSMTSRSPLR